MIYSEYGGFLMSIGSRIKEKRIKLGMTQESLADMIGVTKGAIANYENEVSTPKIDLMYKLFEALQCDANYLHQDEMTFSFENTATPDEFDRIIRKYRALDQRGKDAVDATLDREYKACGAEAQKHESISVS